MAHTPEPRSAALLRRAVALSRPWPLIGAAWLLLLLVAAVTDATQKWSDWLLYLVPVSLIPAVALLLLRLPQRAPLSRVLRFSLAAAGLLLLLGFALARVTWQIVPLLLLQLWLTRAVWQHAVTDHGRWLNAGVALVTAAGGWATAATAVWWGDAAGWLQQEPWRLVVLIVLTAGLSLEYSRHTAARWILQRPLLLLFDVAVLIVLLLIALRTDMINGKELNRAFGAAALHHWSAFVGPADLLRAGAWPLWDVPLQYGLLNTLLIAWLPFDSWINLYLLQAMLQAATAWLIYRVLRMTARGPLSLIAAAALAAVGVFFASGYRELLTGNYAWPSMGALRFFWLYVLLILLQAYARSSAVVPQRRRRLALIGDLCWLIGCCWSFESAIACSVIWLPAAAALAVPQVPTARTALAALVARWRRPAVLAITAGVALSVLSLIGRGGLPDWTAYSDYLLAFGTRFSPTPIMLMQRDGAVVSALALLLAATAAAAALYARGERAWATLLAAGAVTVWAVSSYALQRGLELLFGTMVLPALLLLAALLLQAVQQHRLARVWQFPIQAMVVPLFALLLTSVYAEPQLLRGVLQRPDIRAVEQLLPAADEELIELFRRADVQPDDSLALFADPVVRLPGDSRLRPAPWLPVPQVMYIPLTEQQAQRYIERYIVRTQRSGWMIEPLNHHIGARSPAFAQVLRRTHRARRSVQSDNWRLTWYELRPTGSAAAEVRWDVSDGNGMVWQYLAGDPADAARWEPMTTAQYTIYGRAGVDGWSLGPAEPLIGFEAGTSAVLVHPGVDSAVMIVWRSPIDGYVALQGGLYDSDALCGNGVAWQVRLPDGAVIAGRIANGAGVDLAAAGAGGALPERVAVAVGTEIVLVIDAAGEYSCDSTEVTWEIAVPDR